MNIYELADKAGVSIATVSRVLNGSDRVKPATRQKIEQLIEESGYTRFDAHARRKSTNAVGFICVSLKYRETALLVHTVTTTLAAHGYRTILCCTEGDLSNLHVAVDHMIKHVDVFVIEAGAFNELPQQDRTYLMNVAKHKPIVLLNGRIESRGIYSLSYDQATPLGNLVQEYLRKGITDILFLFSSMSFNNLRLLEQYREAFQRYQLEPSRHWMHICPDFDASYQYMKELLQEGHVPQAVITTHSEIEYGIREALHEQNLQPDLTYACTECRDSSVGEILTTSLLQLLERKEAASLVIIPGKL